MVIHIYFHDNSVPRRRAARKTSDGDQDYDQWLASAKKRWPGAELKGNNLVYQGRVVAKWHGEGHGGSVYSS